MKTVIMKKDLKIVLIMILVLVLIPASLITGFAAWYIKISYPPHNYKSFINEGKIYYTAWNKDYTKISIYLFDLAKNKSALFYSSEKYDIGYFCTDKDNKDVIYFVGRYNYDNKQYNALNADIVKLENGIETILYEFYSEEINNIEKIDNRLMFKKHKAMSKTSFPNEEYIYSMDLNDNTVSLFSKKIL